MYRSATIALTSLLLTASPTVAGAWLGNGGLPPAPVPQRPMPEEERTSPYPTNYAEEVAQRLGVQNGKVSLFEIRPQDDRSALMPTFSGNLGPQGAMFSLKWKP
jgi:hypothetical protein